LKDTLLIISGDCNCSDISYSFIQLAVAFSYVTTSIGFDRLTSGE
jgi:hypothetical protein